MDARTWEAVQMRVKRLMRGKLLRRMLIDVVLLDCSVVKWKREETACVRNLCVSLIVLHRDMSRLEDVGLVFSCWIPERLYIDTELPQ